MMKIGILEQGKRKNNTNSMLTLQDIVIYATKAEEYGFSRFWLTEHHESHPLHAYTRPDTLVSIIAGMTENIRVGSAGVLVNLYPPLSVVTNYKMMNNLFDDRIDLGLANSFTDIDYVNEMNTIKGKTSHAIYQEKVTEISALVHQEEYYFEEKELVIPPFRGLKPDLWHLSTSYNSADFAIKNKLNLCRSIFHYRGHDLANINYDKEGLLTFKEKYKDQHGETPQTSVALAFLMSESLATSQKKLEEGMKKIAEGTNAFVIIPTTPNHLYDLLHSYQENFGIDEFILYDVASENEKMIDNLSIISEMFQLSPIEVS